MQTRTPHTIDQFIVAHCDQKVARIPGIEHRTLAGDQHGLRQLSVWRQTLAPGAATPPHRHDAEEVVLCHAGSGELHLQGRVHRFGPDTSVLIPRDARHQIFNVGNEPMEITAVFAAAPLEVFGADERRMELPW